MTNLNNIKSNNSNVLNEIKYYAMAGYTIESVNFNDDSINMIRHLDTTKHPISLINYKKNRLHLVSLNTEKPINQITAMSTATIAESVFNSSNYEDYIKNNGEKALEEYHTMCMKLQQLGAKEFEAKSEVLFSQIKGVNNQFKQKLQQHLESVRQILINAELCDENFLNKEIQDLQAVKTTTSNHNVIEKDNI